MTESTANLPFFFGLSEEQVAGFMDMGRKISLQKDEVLFSEGDDARGLYIVLSGELTISKEISGRHTILARVQPGAFVGEISLLTGRPHTATVSAEVDSRLLFLKADLFEETLNASPVTRLIFGTMAERLRANEAMIQQHEKLSALGKLAAGLAHELNNPSAANLRAARQLPEAFTTLQNLAFKLNQFKLNREQLNYMSELQEKLVQQAADPVMLDPIDLSDREEALAQWLETQGIPDAWRFAPTFASAGVGERQLTELRDTMGQRVFEEALTWLEGMLTLTNLLTTVQQSTTRICELVSAVKSYTYLDRSALQYVNVHEGLENTLTIMAHKLRDVTVNRHYDHTLPPILVHGSELNQVWTNLLDNAVDAMDGQGQIDIRTWPEDDMVIVEIADNGPGISPEIQSRIFEPFFTTKEVGRGSGLGLDIVYRIVVHKHHGDIRLQSEPGNTRFRVYLPTTPREETVEPAPAEE
ncbi:MAG TPA: ATP-binding protein [Candidatus Sulfomarinibacteraceae bacterium]|nr:ATP-binding protein [Candidatus Sulfomarinibacteraceae bacterium]